MTTAVVEMMVPVMMRMLTMVLMMKVVILAVKVCVARETSTSGLVVLVRCTYQV